MNFWEPIPLFRLAICLAIGVFWGVMQWPLLSMLCWAAGLWWFIHFRLALRKRSAPLFIVTLLLGVGLGHLTERPLPLLPAIDPELTGLLRVEDQPRNTKYGFRFEALMITHRDSLPIKVMVYSQTGGFDPGEVRAFSGRLASLPVMARYQDFDYGSWLLEQGIVARVYVDSIGPVVAMDKNWKHYLLSLRQRSLSDLPVTPFTKDLLAALALGDRSGLDHDIRSSFRDAGVMHLLAVSGLHVGLVMMLCTSFFGMFRNRVVRSIGEVLAITIVWLYALICGAGPSVCRAATMLSLISFGRLLGKHGQGLNMLGLSAMILLMLDPTDLFDAGFQLSYLAVCGIMLFPTSKNMKESLVNDIRNACGVSITAQLWTSPVTLKLFGGFPSYFLLGNLLLLPLATLILYLGIALILASNAGWGWLAQLLAFPLDGLVFLLIGLSELIADLPYSSLPMRIDSSFIVATSVLFIFFLNVAYLRRRVSTLIAVMPLICFILLIDGSLEKPKGAIHFEKPLKEAAATDTSTGFLLGNRKFAVFNTFEEFRQKPPLAVNVLVINTKQAFDAAPTILSSTQPELIILRPGLGKRQSEIWTKVARSGQIPIYGSFGGYTSLRAWNYMPYLCEDEYSNETDRMPP